jgi:hypothetical protein
VDRIASRIKKLRIRNQNVAATSIKKSPAPVVNDFTFNFLIPANIRNDFKQFCEGQEGKREAALFNTINLPQLS